MKKQHTIGGMLIGGIMVALVLGTLPEIFRHERMPVGETQAGVDKLLSMESRDLYAIENDIASAWSEMSQEYPAREVLLKNDNASTVKITGYTEGEKTANVETNHVAKTAANAEKDVTAETNPASNISEGTSAGTSVKINREDPSFDPQNYRIPLVINDSAVDYCAGVDVSSYNYKEIFADSLVMGDSIAESLDSFHVLNSSSVVAKIGISMLSIEDQLAIAAPLAPKNVFLYYGLNDVAHVQTDYEKFKREYENVVVRVQETMPEAKIYANLLFPVINPGIAGGSWYEDLSPYNEVIREVCAEHNIICMDNTGIVKEEFFEPDGCHFKYAFYDYWLYSMALHAGKISFAEQK